MNRIEKVALQRVDKANIALEQALRESYAAEQALEEAKDPYLKQSNMARRQVLELMAKKDPIYAEMLKTLV